jgi:YesN/AraC family two-component response regulator
MLDVIFYTIYKWPEKIPSNNISCHNYHEIGYVLYGDGEINLDGKIHSIKNNSFLIIPKEVSHSEISGRKKLTIFYVGFLLEDDNLWNELKPDVFELNNFNLLSEIKLMINEMKKDSRFKDEIMSKLFEILFLELYRTLTVKTENKSQEKPESFIDDAINYMKENISRDIDLIKISNRYNLNRNYFTTVFKLKTGFPPSTFIKQLRVDIAKKMLLEGGYTVTEVSQKIGILDPYYFCRIFKELTGMSPTAFRNLNNEK